MSRGDCSVAMLLQVRPPPLLIIITIKFKKVGFRAQKWFICFLWHDNHWKIWKIQVVLMKTIIDYLLIIDHWRFMYLCKYCKYCLNLIAWLLAGIAQKESLKNTNYSRVSPLHRFINIFKNHVSFQIKVKIKTIWTNAIRSIVLVDNI